MVERRHIFFRMLHPLAVIFAYLFLYLPIFVLVIFSFNRSATSVEWTGFTLDWYKLMLSNSELIESLKVSLIIAFASMSLSVFIGTLLVFSSKWWRTSILFNVFYANILFPEIIISIGLLSFFTLLRIPLGYGSLIIGHTLLGLGFVIPIMRARFIELDPFLSEASADLGASNLQTFRKILLPLLVPSLVASSLLVFTLSLDDFLIAFFCSSANVQTLSVYVFSMVREGVNPSINAISTCLLVLSSLFVLILSFMNVIEKVVGHE